MNTNELIHNLKADLRPVKPLPSPLRRFAGWVLAAALCLGAGLAYFGFRHDFSQAVLRPVYLLETGVLLLLVLSASFSAFLLSVPGWENSKLSWKLAFLPPLLWGLLSAIRLVAESNGDLHPGQGWSCICDILTIGVLPAALLFFMVRRAAPQKLGVSGVFVLFAGTALGALGAQLSCANDTPLHVIVWHFVPVLGSGALGILLGLRFIARRN